SNTMFGTLPTIHIIFLIKNFYTIVRRLYDYSFIYFFVIDLLLSAESSTPISCHFIILMYSLTELPHCVGYGIFSSFSIQHWNFSKLDRSFCTILPMACVIVMLIYLIYYNKEKIT